MQCLVGFGAVLVALGVFRLVGCSEETPLPLECVEDADCDDANECTDDSCVEKRRWFEGKCYGRCENSAVEYRECDFDGLDDILGALDGVCVAGVCEKNPCDDGNECTLDFSFGDGSCENDGCYGCQPCDRNGEPGVCDRDVCAEYPCDDGDLCTRGWCYTDDGMCQFFPRCVDSNVCTDDTCDPETGECSYPPADGKSCCVRWVGCGGVCIPGPCDWCCERWGQCEDGECV